MTTLLKTSTAVLFFVIIFYSSCKVKNNPESEISTSPKVHPFLSAWEMQQVSWISADTTVTIESAQPGIFMLSENRYSLIWTRTRTPRTAFKILSKPTDEEIKAGFQSVVFNSGTYELKDSTLVTTALLAKVPGFESGQQFYEYKIVDDQLTLTMVDETYPDGSKPAWSGVWKTQFVMKRATD